MMDRNQKSCPQSQSPQRPWITYEAVEGLPSAFGVNESDILLAIKKGIQRATFARKQQKPEPEEICQAVQQSPYLLGLRGRSELGQNGSSFGTGGLVWISYVDKGWASSSRDRIEDKENVSVGTLEFMPDTGAIRCFEKPFEIPSEEPRSLDHLFNPFGLSSCARGLRLSDWDDSKPKQFTAPLSSIKLTNFPREEASASLANTLKDRAPSLSPGQIGKIITPLLDRLDEVSRNITESLCGKLIPFARDIVKSGQQLELNAYNFTTTVGTTDEQVYRWAQAQYQPLITLLQRMEPERLQQLSEAISLQKGEQEITDELADLFSCSPCLIRLLTTTKPDVKQLALIAPYGNSSHITDPALNRYYLGVSDSKDDRSVLERFMSVSARLDDKGAENLTNIFDAARRNALSLKQVALSLFCQSTEALSKDSIVNILPQLLREIEADEPLSYSNLNEVREKVRTVITDLNVSMVRPLLSEKAGFRKALVTDEDGRNPQIDEMIRKIMLQKDVASGDYIELARTFEHYSVEGLIREWPLAEPFNKKASTLTYCLAIMGGMDNSEIDDAYLSEASARKVNEFPQRYELPVESEFSNRLVLPRYFFKQSGDDSWGQLLKGEANGRLCKIIPQPTERSKLMGKVLQFSCLIIDPSRDESIGTLELRVKKEGDSYKVITNSVRVGDRYSNSFEKDGKLPEGYESLGGDIRAFVDGLNSRMIDPEFFDRVEAKLEEFKLALSQKIHEIIDRLHPEPQGGFGKAMATANKRLSKIFPWLDDLQEMWKLTEKANELMGNQFR